MWPTSIDADRGLDPQIAGDADRRGRSRVEIGVEQRVVAPRQRLSIQAR